MAKSNLFGMTLTSRKEKTTPRRNPFSALASETRTLNRSFKNLGLQRNLYKGANPHPHSNMKAVESLLKKVQIYFHLALLNNFASFPAAAAIFTHF